MEIMCPICLTKHGEFNKMIFRDGYFKCPVCKSEVWPDEDKPDELEKLMQDMRKTHYDKEPLPAGQAVRGKSGCHASGRSNTQIKDKTPQQLYNQLFKNT